LRGYAADVLTTLGRLHVVTGEIPKAIDCFERAAQLALQAQLNRLVAPAMLELAKLYRVQGDLRKAQNSAAIGVQAARRIAEVYTWPQELAVQAELKASKGEFQEADALYERATDVIEGMLVNVSGATSRSSLVGAMSDIYVKHFNLAVLQLNDLTKAFRILEQARGRSEADMVRFRSSEARIEPTRRTAADAEITRLQLRLRATERPAERRMLLSRIFEVKTGSCPNR
jgi:tetratricopeptide (TPR) repeat protein